MLRKIKLLWENSCPWLEEVLTESGANHSSHSVFTWDLWSEKKPYCVVIGFYCILGTIETAAVGPVAEKARVLGRIKWCRSMSSIQLCSYSDVTETKRWATALHGKGLVFIQHLSSFWYSNHYIHNNESTHWFTQMHPHLRTSAKQLGAA